MAWHAKHAFDTKRSAPRRSEAARPWVTLAGSAPPSSFGTHGDSTPATVSDAYAIKGRATAPIAAGRPDQGRSPSGQRSGTRERNTNAKSRSTKVTIEY